MFSTEMLVLRSFFANARNYLDSYLQNRLAFNQLLRPILAAAIIVYGFEAFNFNLSIDEEVSAAIFSEDDEKIHWIKIGRWGMFLLGHIIMPFSIVPVIPLTVAVIFYILGLIAIFYFWQREFYFNHVFSGFVAVAFPSLIFIFSFSMLGFGIGLGYFLVGIGFVILVSRSTKIDALLSSLVFAFALSIYQSFALVILTAFCGYQLNQLFAENQKVPRQLTRELRTFVLVLASAGILYFAIQRLLMFIYSVNFEYIENYWHPEYFFNNPMAVLMRVVKYFNEMLFLGSAALYIDRIYSLPVLIVGCLASIAWGTYRRRGILDGIYAILLSIVLLSCPFLFHLLNNGEMPVRSILALPIALSAIVFVGFRFSNGISRYILIGLAVFTSLQLAVITVRLENSGNLALQADRILGANLIERVQRVASASGPLKPRYLDVAGFHSWPETPLHVKREHIGASFFEWDEGNIWRIYGFLTTLGFDDLKPIPLSQRCSLIQQVSAMTPWPSERSVKQIDDIVVIKFGDYTQTQRKQGCNSISNN